MTEEDTFRILKRLPIKEMSRLVANVSIRLPLMSVAWFDSSEILFLLNKNGWKGREYCQHIIQRFGMGEADFRSTLLWSDV
jgi:hypothetical protein